MYTYTHTIFQTHTNININIPWSLDLVEISGCSLQVLRFWLFFHRSSPLRIETAIRDSGNVFQAPSLLPLLFAHWFSFLLCHPSLILFHVPSRLTFVVVLRPMSRAHNSLFASIRSWLVVRSLHLIVATYGGSLSSLQPSTSNIGGVANTPGSSYVFSFSCSGGIGGLVSSLWTLICNCRFL